MALPMKPELAPLSPLGHSKAQKLATMDTHAHTHTHTHTHTYNLFLLPQNFHHLQQFQLSLQKKTCGKKEPSQTLTARATGGERKEQGGMCVVEVGCVGVPI